MARFGNILRGGGSLGRIITSVIAMVAGKVVTDKMTKKMLKQQTGFESTDEIIADAQVRAEKAQADAQAQVQAMQAQNTPPASS